MNRLIVTAIALIATLLSGCATGSGDKQTIGTILGGVAGAAIGSEVGGHGGGRGVAIAAGAILGAMAGSAVGKALDEHDQMMLAQAQQHAFEYSPSGQATTWTNPDTGHGGVVTPSPAYQSDGQYCREFTQQITVGGKTETGYGTACRQPDGSWKIQN